MALQFQELLRDTKPKPYTLDPRKKVLAPKPSGTFELLAQSLAVLAVEFATQG